MPFKTVAEQTHIVVSDLQSLEGLSIPNPELNQAVIVYVAENNSYYQLSLDNDEALEPANTLPTIIGGTSKWQRTAITPIPPGFATSILNLLRANGQTRADGERSSGQNYASSELVADGHYRVFFEKLIGINGVQHGYGMIVSPQNFTENALVGNFFTGIDPSPEHPGGGAEYKIFDTTTDLPFSAPATWLVVMNADPP